MAKPLSHQAATALKQWEVENEVKSTTDTYYDIDWAKVYQLQKEKPWATNPKYFTSVKMSILALIKIVMHAKTGQGKQAIGGSDWLEVMGLVQGYCTPNTFVLTDSFGLPVDATEVEATMNDASLLYMVNYQDLSGEVGRKERSVGWYHSHPGLTCFLSGIDVNTQTINQTTAGLDPWVAIVVDPVKTISSGKVDIKAFRTFPEKYVPDDVKEIDEEIPQSRVAEMGAYWNRYYEIPITIYRSEADAEQLNLLWSKYWMKTLSTSPLVTSRFFTDSQIDLATQKLEKVTSSTAAPFTMVRSRRRQGDKGPADPMSAVSQSVATVGNEVLQGMLGMVSKEKVFFKPKAQ